MPPIEEPPPKFPAEAPAAAAVGIPVAVPKRAPPPLIDPTPAPPPAPSRADGYTDVPATKAKAPQPQPKPAPPPVGPILGGPWVKTQILDPIRAAVPLQIPPHLVDATHYFPNREWARLFKTQANRICWVAPEIFEDEWDPNFFRQPRLDLVCHLLPNTRDYIRYHPGCNHQLIHSSAGITDAMRNRMNYRRNQGG